MRSNHMLQWLCAGGMVFMSFTLGASGFQLTFDPHGTGIIGGQNITGGTAGGNDGSRFFQSEIRIGGRDYFQVVVGDPALGFVMEAYTTRYASLDNYGKSLGVRPASPNSGGNERSLMGGFSLTETNIRRWPGRLFGNAKDPFGTTKFTYSSDPGTPLAIDQRYRISGNGTMNPNRMVMRMAISDEGLNIAVEKPLLERKAKITQTLRDGPLVTEYIADMRGLSYSDSDKTVDVVNRLRLENPDMFVPGSGDFDQGLMAQKSVETAGRYAYTPGTGWNTSYGWDYSGSRFDPGSYAYVGNESFDPLTVHWERYFSYEQNSRYCETENRRFSVCPQ